MVTYRGLAIDDPDSICLDVLTYNVPPTVRGEDIVIPGKAGRTHMTRVQDILSIELRGFVKGIGSSLAARQADWRDNTDDLMDVMDRTLAPGELILQAGYLGLAIDRMATAKCVNIIPGVILASQTFQLWTFELHAVDPPYWEDAESPS